MVVRAQNKSLANPTETYPGLRGFLLFFLGTFCDASFIFFYWHEALRAEKRKPLVKTVGILTFMPSAF